MVAKRPAYTSANLAAALSQHGTHQVVRLTRDHVQAMCPTIPAGTLGVLREHPTGKHIFCFPHDVLPCEDKYFSDGHIRIVCTGFEKVGRINRADFRGVPQRKR